MYVILVYDICTEDKNGKRRLPLILKTCREFLHHSQKSVFEGEISESSLKNLEYRIRQIIDRSKDSVRFFKIANKNNVKKENLGLDFDPSNEII